MQPEPEYDGNLWEEKVKRWLRIRHQSDFEEMPAGHGGDLGIEGFCRNGDKSMAFQCYACREPLSAKVLYDRQRIKLNTDIKKFIDRRTELSLLFHNVKISKWCFIVNEHKSAQLTLHAASKTKEVIAAALPYIASKFDIHIETEKDFFIEQKKCILSNNDTLRIKKLLSDEEVEDWVGAHDSLVNKIDEKVGRMLRTKDSSYIQIYRDQLLQYMALGENNLDFLQEKYPEMYERVIQCRRDKQRSLIISRMEHEGTPKQIVSEQRTELQKSISSAIPALDLQNVTEICHSIIATWIAECPLDFPEV